MLARDIMTPNPVCTTSTDSVQKAAQLMREHHCGCVPVVNTQGDRVVIGIVTDRDLALRVIAPARPPDTPVGEVMSSGVSCCLADTRVEEVEQIMMQRQVRRVPVVDSRGACLGVVALGDIAAAALRSQVLDDSEVGRLVEYVSSASEEARTEADVGVYVERLRSAVAAPDEWPKGARAPREIVT